jgi:hypothetical protein
MQFAHNNFPPVSIINPYVRMANFMFFSVKLLSQDSFPSKVHDFLYTELI